MKKFFREKLLLYGVGVLVLFCLIYFNFPRHLEQVFPESKNAIRCQIQNHALNMELGNHTGITLSGADLEGYLDYLNSASLYPDLRLGSAKDLYTGNLYSLSFAIEGIGTPSVNITDQGDVGINGRRYKIRGEFDPLPPEWKTKGQIIP